MNQHILYRFWPKQQFAFDLIFERRIEQMLYGGAAGGGKSRIVRGLAAYIALLWPGSDFAIFRRTDTELQENHVEKWMEEVDPFVQGGRFFQQRMFYHWPAPEWCWDPKNEPCSHSSRTLFRHVDDNRGAKKHQGAEHAGQGLDEATHFKGSDIEFLYTRVRATDTQRDPGVVIGPDGKDWAYPGWPGWLKLQLLTANPGDIGHQYMLDNFVDPEAGLEFGDAEENARKLISEGPHHLTNPAGLRRWIEGYTTDDGVEEEIIVDVTDGKQWTVEIDLGPGRGVTHIERAFVPARLEDNPSLDPIDYAANLAVGSVEQRVRLLEGDWSYAADRVFKQISADIHKIDGRRIFGEDRFGHVRPPPHSYPRAIGQDHGTAKPTCAIFGCVEDEGFVIAYREYYAIASLTEHVRSIRDIMDWDGHPDVVLQGDPRIYTNFGVGQQTVNVAKVYGWGGEPPRDEYDAGASQHRGVQLTASRIRDDAALTALDDMLTPVADRLFPYWHPNAGQGGAPLLFITDQCPNLWRELTSLQRPADPDGYAEGIKNGQPDHAFDALKRIADLLRRGMFTQRTRGPRRELVARS